MTDELILDKKIRLHLCKVYAQTVLVDIHMVIHSGQSSKACIFRACAEVDQTANDAESTIRAEHKG